MASTNPGKKSRKFGRNLVKCQRYRSQFRRERNKLRRILKSNGLVAAREWAFAHNITLRLVGRAIGE